jgi:trigger factor
MSVNVERLSENSVKITIDVTTEEFDVALDKAFAKVVKEVKADGFRPGKMPKTIFIQRYGWESLYNDALQFVFEETYPKAIMEAKVYPTNEPKVDLDFSTLKKGSGFTYTAEVDVWPEVHLGEYKGIKVKPMSTRVTKKDVDAEVKKVLESKVENVIKEDPAEKGDTVVIDFEGFVDGVAFEGGKGENYGLELGSNSFIPGFEDQLIGTKTDDEVDVNVTFPKDYHANLAGKKAVFKVKVHEVKQKVYPELNDDLVKELDIKGVETVDAYLEYTKGQLKKNKTTAAENHMASALLEAVCKNSYAEFPESLIQSEVEYQVKNVEKQAKQYNLPVDVLLQYSGIQSIDDFKKGAEENARKSFLQELVIDEIIKLENIVATAEEIENQYRGLAGVKDEDDEATIAKKIANAKKQYKENQVAYRIKADKVIELLKKNAITKEEK